jgi:hypothetical protein
MTLDSTGRAGIPTHQRNPEHSDIASDAEMISTLFLSLTIPLSSSPARLREQVEVMLRSHGEPLRWAITSVDIEQQTAQVEAVVTQGY